MELTISVSLDINPVWFEGRSLIDYGVRKLDGRDGDIFHRYFVEQMTMREIASDLGLTCGRIQQIVSKLRLIVRRRIGCLKK